MPFELSSTAFEEKQTIPRQFTREGSNTSPPLKWPDPPEDSVSFALVVEDPDAPRGTFTHWVIFNMPGMSWELSESVPHEPILHNGTVQGTNSFGHVGYDGPQPPPGKPHRYFFELFAVDRMLDLGPGASKDDMLAALEGHILAEAQLMGTYQHNGQQIIPEDPMVKKALQDQESIHTAPLE